MNAEMPRLPAARSVTAMTTMTWPTRPCVVNVLEPLSTQSSPSRRGLVRMPAASLPEVDSVSPQAPIFSPRASGDEILLLLRLGAEHEDVRRAQTVVRGHRQRDRRIDAREFLDADAVVDRRQPRAAVLLGELDARSGRARRASASTRSGKCCASSHSLTCGRISVSANSRTLRRSSACSSVSRKSMTGSEPIIRAGPDETTERGRHCDWQVT